MPLDSQNVAALRWWLLCHGITPSLSAVKLDEAFVVCSNFAVSSLSSDTSASNLANSPVISTL